MNILINRVRKDQEVAIATASSVIAATLLHKGRTVHSKFKIPIPAYKGDLCNFTQQSDLWKEILDAKIIIIDEVVMLNKVNFEVLDDTFRVITRNVNSKFGGKLIIIGGCFRNTLPVIPRGSRASIVNSVIKKSSLWESVTTFCLTKNMQIEKNNPEKS